MTRVDGRLVTWNDDRGFGFITTPAGGQIFVHIKSFGYGSPRPEVGDVVSYRLGTSHDGRPQALEVRGVGAQRTIRRSTTRATDFLPIVLFIGCYVAAQHYWVVPLWVAGLYLAASAATFIAYAIDKSRARDGGWRISEGFLNLLAFVGGWPGAIVAQQALRHKTIKASFRAKFWMAVVGNILVFVAVASPWGHALLAQFVSSSL